MSEQPIPVIPLGVRSQDEEPGKDSAGDQERLVREWLLGQPGRFLFNPEHRYVDHGSGYRGNRGEETQRAMQDARRAAAEYGRAELGVFKSERLARGSGLRDEARSLLEVFVEMRRAGVTLRSMEDDVYFSNPMLIGVADEMAHKYARDLSAHVQRGLRERKERGEPTGPVPFGFMVEEVCDAGGKSIIKNNGKVLTRRVVDPITGPVVVIVYERFASGEPTGDLARWLNDQGYRTIRDKPWNADAVRWMIENDSYEGNNGYPAIVTSELAQRARDQLKRTDPAARQRRKGGRPPKTEAILRGIAHCACGAPMYCLSPRYDRPRRYVCREVHQGTGLCDRPWISAEAAEVHILHHLDEFIGDLEGWARKQITARSDEHAAIERQLEDRRADLAELDARRAQRMAELENVGFHPVALEVVQRLDVQREQVQTDIEEAEARLAEWTAAPTLDAIFDFYNGLRDLVAGRVKRAQGAPELNVALADVLAGVWLQIDGGLLRAEFELRRRPETDDVLGGMLPVGVRLPTYAPKDPYSYR